jgi:hypothetical protein
VKIVRERIKVKLGEMHVGRKKSIIDFRKRGFLFWEAAATEG